MSKFVKPVGFKFRNWRDFRESLTERDIELLEKNEKQSEEEIKNPCPRCGGKVKYVEELSSFVVRCQDCGFTRDHDCILFFKD